MHVSPRLAHLLYSSILMYRLLIILIPFLFTTHAVHASVAIPYVFVKNHTVDDYKASCQNWSFSLTPDGMLYA